MITAESTRTWKAYATTAATAWLNAAIASSSDDSRLALYRTICVEFFRGGIQLVGCDGHMLFRTWAPYSDVGDLPVKMPGWADTPRRSVIVRDIDNFALGFMRTLLQACKDIPAELSFTIEDVEKVDEPPLGDDFYERVLTLHALGQRLSCKLYEGEYPDWRALNLGVDPTERVEGMVIGTKLFAAVGKLRGVNGVELTFRGEESAVEFRAQHADVCGILMPMRKLEKKEKAESTAEPGDAQLEHEEVR